MGAACKIVDCCSGLRISSILGCNLISVGWGLPKSAPRCLSDWLLGLVGGFFIFQFIWCVL